MPALPARHITARLRIALLPLLLAACANNTAPSLPKPVVPPPSGTIEMNRKPLKEELIAGGGNGVVYFDGNRYGFAASGLGVYGDAVANVQAIGRVSQMSNLSQFPGTYRQIANPGGPSNGDLWMRNEYGVVIHLQAPPQGQLPDLDGDALRVELR